MTSRIKAQAGFTLIEVMVVLAILAVAISLVLARGPARSPGLEARESASQLAQTLRLARSRAIAADRPVPVALDLATHALTLDGAPRPPLAASTALAITPPGRIARFLFQPDGSASGGAVLIGAGTRRIAVAVDWLTGRVGVDAR